MVEEINRQIYDAVVAAIDEAGQFVIPKPVLYLMVPDWVYKWLQAEAKNMGVYCNNNNEVINTYMGLTVCIDPFATELADIKVVRSPF